MTFHLNPASAPAELDYVLHHAEHELNALIGIEGTSDIFVAVRGIRHRDGEACLYLVTRAPDDHADPNKAYMWEYVHAMDWLEAYDARFYAEVA